ncbi:MAG TPA: hypothetical protein ENJ09_08985 [Planctomycetes bacterium]|nr:hypothetical protein [Planctomycetota bacterium]
MATSAATLHLIARVHAGDGGSPTKFSLKPGSAANVDATLPFQLPSEVSTFTSLNKSTGVTVEHASGPLPTLQECLDAVRAQVRAEIPAQYDVEESSSLPDYTGTVKGHAFIDGHWVRTGGNNFFSAGFRIVYASSGEVVKQTATIEGETVWMDYLVVIQSVL